MSWTVSSSSGELYNTYQGHILRQDYVLNGCQCEQVVVARDGKIDIPINDTTDISIYSVDTMMMMMMIRIYSRGFVDKGLIY